MFYFDLYVLSLLSPSDCGSMWPGPSTTRTRRKPPMKSSSWRKLRGRQPASGRPNARSGSLHCLSRTPSLGSGITDMPSEWSHESTVTRSHLLHKAKEKVVQLFLCPTIWIFLKWLTDLCVKSYAASVLTRLQNHMHTVNIQWQIHLSKSIHFYISFQYFQLTTKVDDTLV